MTTAIDSLEKAAGDLLAFAAVRREKEAQRQELACLQERLVQIEAELAELGRIQIRTE